MSEKTEKKVLLTRENLVFQLKNIVNKIQVKVKKKILPAFDSNLTDNNYLEMKVQKFLAYCVKKKYLIKNIQADGEITYSLNMDMVLAEHPKKLFRKHNPLAYHANELLSLGEKSIKPLFNISIPENRV